MVDELEVDEVGLDELVVDEVKNRPSGCRRGARLPSPQAGVNRDNFSCHEYLYNNCFNPSYC